MKRFLIVIALSLLATVFLPSARSLEAAEDCWSGYGPPPPGQEFCCTFTPASGINLPGGSLPCDGKLLANYIVALNVFFYRLAIVLAVLMITIGGFQWLSAMGNVGKIGNAKETIEQAVIGLALAFTAYLIFSQIDERFVNLSSLDLTTKKENLVLGCGQFSPQNVCEEKQYHPLIDCKWKCLYPATGVVDCSCVEGTSLCNPLCKEGEVCVKTADADDPFVCLIPASSSNCTRAGCPTNTVCVKPPGGSFYTCVAPL